MRIKKYFSYRTEVRQRMEFHLIFPPLSKIQECKHDDGNESRKKFSKGNEKKIPQYGKLNLENLFPIASRQIFLVKLNELMT